MTEIYEQRGYEGSLYHTVAAIDGTDCTGCAFDLADGNGADGCDSMGMTCAFEAVIWVKKED
jgi:hypothetical protein